MREDISWEAMKYAMKNVTQKLYIFIIKKVTEREAKGVKMSKRTERAGDHNCSPNCTSKKRLQTKTRCRQNPVIIKNNNWETGIGRMYILFEWAFPQEKRDDYHVASDAAMTKKGKKAEFTTYCVWCQKLDQAIMQNQQRKIQENRGFIKIFSIH